MEGPVNEAGLRIGTDIPLGQHLQNRPVIFAEAVICTVIHWNVCRHVRSLSPIPVSLTGDSRTVKV
ncbi:hypothetical protein D3C72_2455240 [compost metagenome]